MIIELTTTTQILYYTQVGEPVVFHTDKFSGYIKMINNDYIIVISTEGSYGKESKKLNRMEVDDELHHLIKQGAKFYK